MRDELDIITAYENVGTYRGAAEVCGTTHKTVKRVVARHALGVSATLENAAMATVENEATQTDWMGDLGLPPFGGHPDWPAEAGRRGCPYGCQEEELHPGVPS